MQYFAEYLSRQLRMPVIDRTGLQGDFAFAIEWPAEPGETVRTLELPHRPGRRRPICLEPQAGLRSGNSLDSRSRQPRLRSMCW